MAATPTRMLQILGRKFKERGYAQNCDLIQGENTEVILSRPDGTRLRLSPAGVWEVGDDSQPVFRLAEVLAVHWMEKGDLLKRFRALGAHEFENLKRRRGDCVIVDLKDGRTIDLGNLGAAYLLVYQFLQWHRRNHPDGAPEAEHPVMR